ncbi:DUF4189 domain-containing protein [Nocardia ignorata]|uniref:DUF4189 domain-containing protein n=1 Tax=Nocardia ignorata TaxID=145285 RepID=UPI001FB7948B|nr:DUF4189 domain-containing protein [Nocardia ignorata]
MTIWNVPDFRNQFSEEIFRMSFMGKAGFAVAALGLAAGSVFGAGPADAAGDQWGAIVFSVPQWYGFTTANYSSEEQARARAIENCGGGQDCEVMVTWANGCGALVWNDQGWVAAAAAANRSEAVRRAIDKLAEGVPVAQLANFGSSDLSGTKVIDVVCTDNAR